MPVLASYNDITIESKLRDFVGEVWYEKSVIVPEEWKNKKLFIRVGSASHSSKIWL
jgi:beta-glucuronidase